VSGPNNIRGATLEWTLTAKTWSGQGGKAKSWLIKEAVKALAEDNLPLA
jgi:hypothetical protein